MPLSFSILTPTLNRRAMLAEAIESVSAQNWEAIEHVIADGGSTDGTLEFLAEQARVRVLAGPDRGIYDGLNKALAAAQNDIVGWLNSDDLYAPGAVAAAAEAFRADPAIDAVCGAAQIEGPHGVERVYPAELVADLRPGALLIGPTLPNAWFFRRSVFERVGVFSEAFRYAADADFMMRFARARLPRAVTRALVYRYRRHASSATISDAGAPPELRCDMLRLARAWRAEQGVGDDVRHVARRLEGRCSAALALAALKRGDLRQAASRVQGRAAVIALGVWDYLERRARPGLRRRRLGDPPRSPDA